jgi:DNA modification methylase
MTDFPTDVSSWNIAAERNRLADRLETVRAQPGAPLGEDADVLAMSLPPYATACPNPDLADWLEATEPEDAADRKYDDPGPFTTDISEGKSSLFYKAHSYPTKVPHEAIMRFLLHYTEPGDVVLDGFCGTGMTGVAAQACGAPTGGERREIEQGMGEVTWGYRRAVLADLSPSATFIAAGLNLPIDAKAFDRRSAEILDEFDAEWGWMYRTTDESGKEQPLDYVVWSEVFTCPACASAVVFYDVAYDQGTEKVKDSFRCTTCGKDLSKDTVERRKVPVRTMAGDRIDRVEFRPVAIHYRVGSARKVKAPDDSDLALLRRIAAVGLTGRVPTNALPIEAMYHGSRLAPKGFTRVHHLWGDRALVALSALWKRCGAEEDPLLQAALYFWVEQAMLSMSWQNRYRPAGYSQVGQVQSGIYYIPSLHSETHVRYNLEGGEPARGKRQSLVKTWEQSPARLGQIAITTGSSTRVKLPDASIDYVFVDPPFGSNIPYADLAIPVESWHGVRTDSAEEAVVCKAPRFVRTLAEYGELVERCFAEFFRVLKPGRWITVEFNNSGNDVWLTIQHALARAGFVVADTRMIDKEQLSYRQVTATNAVKRDLIISSYKPTELFVERLGPVVGKPDSAWEFVREHLRHLPAGAESEPSGEVRAIRERLPDRLLARMEAFHIQRNLAIPVTAAEFYDGLTQRFPQRDGMHFLDEQVEAYERQRMTIKELKAAQLFITDEESAIQWLRQFLKSRRTAQPYAAIQPEFFREVQAGLPDWEEPPDLKVLLERSFVQDDEGRWYVPDPKKEADLEKLRKRERLKEFAAYAAGKGELKHFSLAAVRAGFSDAWERRDFKAVVAVGRRLPIEAFAQDERLLFYLDNAEQLEG